MFLRGLGNGIDWGAKRMPRQQKPTANAAFALLVLQGMTLTGCSEGSAPSFDLFGAFQRGCCAVSPESPVQLSPASFLSARGLPQHCPISSQYALRSA
jgi:hypothetical protein